MRSIWLARGSGRNGQSAERGGSTPSKRARERSPIRAGGVWANAIYIAIFTLVGCGGAMDMAGFPEALPSHGGVTGTLGGRSAELVSSESGELSLHVAAEPSELERWAVSLIVTGPDGLEHTVALSYEGRVIGFVGQLHEPAAGGSITALLVRDGRVERVRFAVTRQLPAARHDGAVLAHGDEVVEAWVRADGEVRIYLLAGRLDARVLVVSVEATDRRMHPLEVHLDPELGHWRGRLVGTSPRPGAIEVLAAIDGANWLARGRLARVEDAPEWPEEREGGFQLELPELGSDVPRVIVVPPAGEEGAPPQPDEPDR